MTFTKTPPTEPGMFRRRDEEGYETLAEVNRTDQGCLACKMDGKLGYVVKTMGGEWCRLVPVDEVNALLKDIVRARRVMEGLE